MKVEPLGPEHVPAFAALFEACSAPCYCRYWHHEGDKNAWLERCALDADANLREQTESCARGADDGRGLLAFDGATAVGWLKLAPRASVPKLRNLPVYRSISLGDDAIYSVGCFLVHPEYRRHGVARALLTAAETHVAAWGGRALEAYPRRSGEPLPPEQLMLGPLRLFEELGYRQVGGEGPYPLLRKELGHARS